MDGRGRWMDNVFIERLWRSLKYEDIYLKGYAGGREAKAGIASWITFYNGRRRHQALGNRTPMTVWRQGTTGPFGTAAVDMLDNARSLPTCHGISFRVLGGPRFGVSSMDRGGRPPEMSNFCCLPGRAGGAVAPDIGQRLPLKISPIPTLL
jgi:Integrase core domain